MASNNVYTHNPLPFIVPNAFEVDTNHHVRALSTNTPTLGSVNANVTNQSLTGNDTCGIIQFDVQTGSISAGGNLFTVSFNKAKPSATIVVILTTGPGNQTTGQFYISAANASGFTVRNSSTLAVLTAYKLQYFVIEPN